MGTRYGAGWGTDVDAVIGDPAIDAVVVASPTPTHVDLLTRAVHAGKAVLCEKPIDLDLARVDACRTGIGTLGDRVRWASTDASTRPSATSGRVPQMVRSAHSNSS
ncbi:MAG: idh [Pseudonocardia sp.]|nr:idh [Pseudonocardia sp.]